MAAAAPSPPTFFDKFIFRMIALGVFFFAVVVLMFLWAIVATFI